MGASSPPPLPRNHPDPSSSAQAPLSFTKTGGLLIVLTAIVTLAFALLLPFWLFPRILPQHTRYPALWIVIPTVGFGAVFFGGLAWVTGKLGFPATRPKEQGLENTQPEDVRPGAMPPPLPVAPPSASSTRDSVAQSSHGLLAIIMLAGVAAGHAKDALANLDPDQLFFAYGVSILGALGVVGIGYSWWHLLRRPFLQKFLRMNRPLWFVGAPLAWLCGVGIGLIWRYI